MNRYNIITHNLHGFLEKHDSSNSIKEVIDFVNNSFDNNSISIGIFLDLAKASDTDNRHFII